MQPPMLPAHHLTANNIPRGFQCETPVWVPTTWMAGSDQHCARALTTAPGCNQRSGWSCRHYRDASAPNFQCWGLRCCRTQCRSRVWRSHSPGWRWCRFGRCGNVLGHWNPPCCSSSAGSRSSADPSTRRVPAMFDGIDQQRSGHGVKLLRSQTIWMNSCERRPFQCTLWWRVCSSK